MPYLNSQLEPKQLHLGACIQHVSTINILQLLKYAHNKLKVTFEMEKLRDIISKDTELLNMIRNPVENN